MFAWTTPICIKINDNWVWTALAKYLGTQPELIGMAPTGISFFGVNVFFKHLEELLRFFFLEIPRTLLFHSQIEQRSFVWPQRHRALPWTSLWPLGWQLPHQFLLPVSQNLLIFGITDKSPRTTTFSIGFISFEYGILPLFPELILRSSLQSVAICHHHLPSAGIPAFGSSSCSE